MVALIRRRSGSEREEATPVVDCCTRELVGWNVELRGRTDEAIACVDAAVIERRVPPEVHVRVSPQGRLRRRSLESGNGGSNGENCPTILQKSRNSVDSGDFLL